MKEYLVISTQTDLLRLTGENIMYVSADGNYSTFMQRNGESKTIVKQLGEIETSIRHQMRETGANFIRIGRSLIINKDFIQYINIPRQQLVLSDGNIAQHSLSASKVALSQLKDILDNELNR
ncbi:MAG: LytTR family transcriptional regulator DNA-binding domain-containing protein [Bacteroidales bacterium]|nr:LytTR family transcriptional regulator DNA-binding domain-containing protein [Bacteroidales bacterium]